jgi:hypothetical protein
MRSDPFLRNLYAIADDKGMTVAELMGTERKRYHIKLPQVFADMCGEETVTITEEREGLSANEYLFWQAFYALNKQKTKK